MKTQPPRGPRIFRKDDSRLRQPDDGIAEKGGADDVAGDAVADPVQSSTILRLMRLRRIGWGAIFFSTLGGLISIAVGIWITNFVTDLFARSGWLGYLALILAVLAALAAFIIILRELLGFLRL